VPRDYSLASQPPTAGQRLPEYARGEAWMRAFLHAAQVGHIATQWDDQPFITPTTFWFDEANQRILFHSNLVGRVRANAEHSPKVCFEASEMGRLLPFNVALEFSLQYRSVLVFGAVRVLESDDEKRAALTGLLEKYFPNMRAGREYRPITEEELKRTSVYEIKIETWSGKENWNERAEQSQEWKALEEKWFSA
jgi:nitroimidazol reductase NimA-like FMN-containing flavoprotein (pyridoxamine 5'-phosphate oxidase superfamily)